MERSETAGSDQVTIKVLGELESPAFLRLHRDAIDDGFGALDRLVDDYRDGANRFELPGEILLSAWASDDLVGVCGLNVDPYTDRDQTGRIRRLYVRRDARRRGIGRALVAAVESAAQANFNLLRLRTDDPNSAAFYVAQGYAEVDDPSASHEKALGR